MWFIFFYFIIFIVFACCTTLWPPDDYKAVRIALCIVFSYFPFGFEGRIWDLIVSVPDHCLSFYFVATR